MPHHHNRTARDFPNVYVRSVFFVLSKPVALAFYTVALQYLKVEKNVLDKK